MRVKRNEVVVLSTIISLLGIGILGMGMASEEDKSKELEFKTVREELDYYKLKNELSERDERSQFVVKQEIVVSENSISSNEVEEVNESLLQFPLLSDEDIYYLKKLGTCEAEYVTPYTMSLMMLVVLNRVNDPKFPDTVYEVIMQKNQFSVCKPGGPWYNTEPSEKSDIAFDMIWDTLYDYSGGALYFESYANVEYAKNSWFGVNLEYLYESEGVRFYK